MAFKSIKTILVLVFSTILLSSSYNVIAQGSEVKSAEESAKEKKDGFNAKEVIFGHIMDAHEFHFLEFEGRDGQKHTVSIPLPVILYSPQKGLSFFMSSAFEHRHKEVNGYKLNEDDKVVSTEDGVKVYDFSLTRNVVQMILALILLVWLMISVAKSYATGQ